MAGTVELVVGARYERSSLGVTGNPPRNLKMVRPLDQRIVNSYLLFVNCHLSFVIEGVMGA